MALLLILLFSSLLTIHYPCMNMSSSI